MEDQGERSPQTFLVNNFSFSQPPTENKAIGALQMADLKQLPGL